MKYKLLLILISLAVLLMPFVQGDEIFIDFESFAEYDEISNIDLTKKILEIMGAGEEMIEYVPDRKGHDFRYAVDSSRIEKELDFRREIAFESGLKDTVDWYRENEWWWKKLKKN